MTTTTATAPGKVILFGEHAVVYGQPAIAMPVAQKRAVATVADADCDHIRLLLPDIRRSYQFDFVAPDAPERSPHIVAVRAVQQALAIEQLPPLTITLRSELPIASGLGSGAATAAALIRAVWLHLGGAPISRERLNELVYRVEQLHHGTPSGIDNTTVAYEQPVFFQRLEDELRIEPFPIGRTLDFVIADSGVSSRTWEVVAGVRDRWEADKLHYDRLFARCGEVARAGRAAIEQGARERLGQLMNKNQQLLDAMGVNSAELQRLIDAARQAGAAGAKLSGAGRGGNMIALVAPSQRDRVMAEVRQAGAKAAFAIELTAK